MANDAIDWALSLTLRPVAKLVLLILANRANKDTWECWPSLATIAKETSLDKATVARALSELSRKGLVLRSPGGGTASTVYRLPVAQRDTCRTARQPDLSQSATAPVAERDTTCRTECIPPVAQCDTNPNRTQIEPKLNPNGGKTARKTRAPDQMEISDKLIHWAAENGITADLTEETEKMLDHFRGKGETRLDWEATRRTWLRNSKRFGGHQNVRQSDAQSKEQRTREGKTNFLNRVVAGNAGRGGGGGDD